MKNILDSYYIINDHLVIRTPALPFQTGLCLEEIKQFFENESIKEALYLASPNLFYECQKWIQGNKMVKKDEDKLVNSVIKYLIRMSSRSTPFGMFSGCGVVEIKDEFGQIYINSKFRKTRLDMSYSSLLSLKIVQNEQIKYLLNYFPNNSLFRIKDKIRYVEIYYKNNLRQHQVSVIDNSEYVEEVLKVSKSGAKINDLVQAVLNLDEELDYQEAFDFVMELISSQVLFSELEPSVSGVEQFEKIQSTLKEISQKPFEIIELENKLNKIQKELNFLDQRFENKIEVYENLIYKLKELNVPLEIDKLFQVDLFSEIEVNTVSRSSTKKESLELFNSNIINRNLKEAITVINKLTLKTKNNNLTLFKEAFKKRYEEQEIPLLVALDSELGIGYSNRLNKVSILSPIVDGLMLDTQSSLEYDIKWNKSKSFLFQKLLEALRTNQGIIKINKEDLKDIEEKWDDFPESFSVLYSNIGKRDGEDFLNIDMVAAGSSAVNLIGRFAMGNSQISNLGHQIAKQEQDNNPDLIFAEIVHLPENRTGNVLLRPSFREFEIPYLSKSDLKPENQILLEDLLISVRNNKVILRSKKINKIVVPRLSNAHNFSFDSLPVYEFLCDMQIQDRKVGLVFHWGEISGEFEFLPRVEVNNIVISKKTWNLKKEKYKEIASKNFNLSEIKEWQVKLKLPDLFYLKEGDNKLLINLKCELTCKMFFSEIKNKPSVILEEFLFDEGSFVIKDLEGKGYLNEMITTFERKYDFSQNNINPKQHKKEDSEVLRQFSTGSEWLYYKIYCGVNIADTVLLEKIKPICEILFKNNVIDSWFFIRYGDPEDHLRVRFHITDLSKVGEVVNTVKNFIKDFEQDGLIWKLQLDTYNRELERYGFNSIELIENLFYHDSEFILKALTIIDTNDDLRWKFAVMGIDDILSHFSFTLQNKKKLMEMLKTSFANEFSVGKYQNQQLSDKYRKHKEDLRSILSKKLSPEHSWNSFFDDIRSENKQNTNVFIKKLLNLNKDNKLGIDLDDLLSSYVHMFVNRLFKNNQRTHELVIYDLMFRAYESLIAIEKYKINHN